MSKVIRIFLIISVVWGTLLTTLCFVTSIALFFTKEEFPTLIQNLLINYGIVDKTGYSPVFHTNSVSELITVFRVVFLVLAVLTSIPDYLCLQILRKNRRISFIILIIDGVIGLNVFAIISGALLIHYQMNQDNCYNN